MIIDNHDFKERLYTFTMTGSSCSANHKNIFLKSISQQVANTVCSVSMQVVERESLIEIYWSILLNLGQYISVIGFSAIGYWYKWNYYWYSWKSFQVNYENKYWFYEIDVIMYIQHCFTDLQAEHALKLDEHWALIKLPASWNEQCLPWWVLFLAWLIMEGWVHMP